MRPFTHTATTDSYAPHIRWDIFFYTTDMHHLYHTCVNTYYDSLSVYLIRMLYRWRALDQTVRPRAEIHRKNHTLSSAIAPFNNSLKPLYRKHTWHNIGNGMNSTCSRRLNTTNYVMSVNQVNQPSSSSAIPVLRKSSLQGQTRTLDPQIKQGLPKYHRTSSRQPNYREDYRYVKAYAGRLPFRSKHYIDVN